MKVGSEGDQSEILERNWTLWTRVTKGISNGCMVLSISWAPLAVMGPRCKQNAFFIVHITCTSSYTHTRRALPQPGRSIHVEGGLFSINSLLLNHQQCLSTPLSFLNVTPESS